MATDEPEVITLEDRINALEVELARLRETPGTLGWPNDPTIAQGFAAHRWQRRDGATPTGGLPPTYVSEAPADGYYYGRVNYTWQQVVEEAPSLTSRRSDTGWARASFGADVPWISLDDVLANYLTDDAPVDGFTYGRRNNFWQQLEQVFASTNSPQFLGTPTAPTAPPGDSSLVLANTTFVNAAIAAGGGGGGIPDVPAAFGAYARIRGADTTSWMTLNDLGVAPLASPVFTGVPTAPSPPPGDTSPRLATAQFVAANFLDRAGGAMSGSFIAANGTSATDVGLGIGDSATGFLRVGNTMAIIGSGEMVAQFLSVNRQAMFVWTISAATNPIVNVGDPTTGGDALNLRTADARYLSLANGGLIQGPVQLFSAPVVPNDVATKAYVDSARAPSVTYDFPQNVAVAGDGAWHQVAQVPITLPRTGNSTIMAIMSCNLTDFSNLIIIGARFVNGTPERQVFGYGSPPPGNSSGFSVVMTSVVSGSSVTVPFELASLSIGGAPLPFTVVGGSGVATRSQITIIDLGPTIGSENAEEAQPSRTGQRRAARPHHRRSA